MKKNFILINEYLLQMFKTSDSYFFTTSFLILSGEHFDKLLQTRVSLLFLFFVMLHDN